MTFCLFICILLILNTLLSAENILIVPAHQSKSHLESMLPVINSLISANYNLTLLWTSTVDHKERPKVPQDVHVVHFMIPDGGKTEQNKKLDRWSIDMTGAQLTRPFLLYNEVTREVWEMHGNEILFLMNNQKWDLVITDELFPVLGYAVAMKMKEDHNVPYLMISTTSLTYSASISSALGRSPVSRMSMFWPYPEDPYVSYDPQKFTHRLWNFVDTTGEALNILGFGGRFFMTTYAQIVGNHLQFENIFRRHSGLLLEDIHKMRFPYPVSQDITGTGQTCPLNNTSQLPADLEEFVMDLESKGTIYVAFGTHVSWEGAPVRVREAFDKALNSLKDYRIIVSGKASNVSFGNHVKTMEWVPQKALLEHERTKLFITHGGMKSIKQSISARVPMLIMAVFAEQSQNARLIKETGAGDTINKFTITATLLKDKIAQLLHNCSYRTRIEKLHALLTDEVVSSRKRVIHATKCAISRSSEVYRKYKRRGLLQSWSQYLYLPQILILIIIIIFLCKQ